MYCQLRLEEKARENVSLTRQLENALSDNRQIQEHSRERFASKVVSLQKLSGHLILFTKDI